MVVVTVAGFGTLTWVAFLVLGVRARRRSWLAWSGVYAALLAAFCVLESMSDPNGTNLAAGLALIPGIFAWIGGTVHVSLIAGGAARRIEDRQRHTEIVPVAAAARARIKDRARGRELAAKDPVLAREMGVGRPDVPGSEDHGLIDVNHAGRDALRTLPGVTPEVAARIMELRQSMGPFSSAEDLCVTVNLSPLLTDDLREHAVFL